MSKKNKKNKNKQQHQNQQKKQQPESFFQNEDFMKVVSILLFLNLIATSYLLLDHFGYNIF